MPRTEQLKLPDFDKIREIELKIEKLGRQAVREQVKSHYYLRLAEIEKEAQHLTPEEISAKRFLRLTSDQLLTLALSFMAHLIELNKQGTDTEEKIKELCENETTLLEKGYPTETIAKNHHPLYINLIRDAINNGKITLSEQNSYFFEIYNQEGELKTIHNHYAQLYLKYDRQFYRQVKQKSVERNNIKQDTPKPVRLYPYLDKIKELLQSEQYSELAAGIAAATGRRFSEVIERGTFVIPDKPTSVYELIFEGQLKKATNAPAYSTYSLVPAALIVAAIARLRAIPKIEQLKDASIQKINTLVPTVNYQIKRHFQQTGIVEVLEGEVAVTVHNLRGIYGEIAAHLFCPSRAQFPRFLSQQLGHLIGDETIDNNLSHSTEHYFHYYLIDEDSQTIEKMGIKLNEPLPEKDFVSLASSFLESDDWACKLTGVIATTGVAPDDLLKHFVYKRVEGDNKILYTKQVHSSNTPYFEIVTLTNAQKIRDAIAQLKNHPELKPYLDTHTGKQTLAYVRERIADYLGQLGVETYQLAISQYQARVRQLGVEQKTTSVFVSTPGPDDNHNKRANIRTIESVKREFAQLGKILGTSTQSETLIEIINLAKLALSHPQKTVTSTGSTSHQASFDELTPVLEEPARPHQAPDENLGTLSLLTTDDTVAAASHPTSSEQQADTVESLLLIEHNEELASIEEEVTEPVNPEPVSVTIIDDNNTTSPQQSSTTQLTQTSEVNSNDLTVAITTLVNSMAVLTSRFDRFLERATTPVISNKDRNFSSSMREEEKNKNTNGQTSRRPRRKSAQATERIHDAINALINYNGRVGYEQRWYISAPVLKALAGGAQVTINEVMKNHKHILNEHHQSLGLSPQHNRSFHRGEQITDFIEMDF